MTKVNPKKLLNSKWTAVTPIKKEKHFVVSEVEFDEDGSVIVCKIESVLSKNEYEIDWTELKTIEKWLQGWK